MTKYFVEVLETKDGKPKIKTSEEKPSLIEARTTKSIINTLPDEIVQIHVCRHGDGENGTNEPCIVS